MGVGAHWELCYQAAVEEMYNERGLFIMRPVTPIEQMDARQLLNEFEFNMGKMRTAGSPIPENISNLNRIFESISGLVASEAFASAKTDAAKVTPDKGIDVSPKEVFLDISKGIKSLEDDATLGKFLTTQGMVNSELRALVDRVNVQFYQIAYPVEQRTAGVRATLVESYKPTFTKRQ